MNHMKEVAQMLGVELCEEFEIEGRDGSFMVSENGIQVYEEVFAEEYGWYAVSGNVYFDLLVRSAKIVKKPWIPKDGEKVWAIYSDPEPIIGETHFVSHSYNDLSRFALGCLCRTHEEAEAHAPEIQEQMRRILAGELRAELVEVRK